MVSQLAVAVAALVALAGCAPAESAETHLATGGAGGVPDAADEALPDSGPLTVSAVELDPDTATYRPLADGDSVHLLLAPQGGHVLFIGARVSNLDITNVELRSTVREKKTDTIVQQDTRDTKMVAVPGEIGVLQTSPDHIANVSNIALCPDYGDSDIAGRTFALEVTVTEAPPQDSTGSVTLSVTPVCPPGDAGDSLLCDCECRAAYTLGKCAFGSVADAGAAP